MNSEIKTFIQEALQKHTHGEVLSSHLLSPHGSLDRRTYQVPSIILWDPLLQLFNGVLSCVECGSAMKTRAWKDGRNSHENPRMLYCIEQPVLLVSCVYACTKDHRMVAHDPRILSSCKGDAVPFVLLHKIGFTKKLMFYVVSHVTAGLSYQSIEEVHGMLWEMEN